MIYSIVGDDFCKWVSKSVKVRNDEVADRRDLMIKLDPEIAAAFGNSTNISSKFCINKVVIQSQSWHVLYHDSDEGARCPHSQARKQETKATS